MHWSWQSSQCPVFTYDSKALEPLERDFLLRSGEFIGALPKPASGDTRVTISIFST